MRARSITKQRGRGEIGVTAKISWRRKPRQLSNGQSLARFAGASVVAVGIALVGLCLSQPPPARADWTAPIPVDVGQSLNAVTCTSSTTCIALDSAGNLVSSNANGSGPAYASAWKPPTPIGFQGNGGAFTAVSCPNALSFCAAFDSNGNVLYSSNALSSLPTWQTYAALTDIFGNPNTEENTEAADALACTPAQPTVCFAADSQGNLVYSTNVSSARNQLGEATWSQPGYDPDPSTTGGFPTAITSLSCPSTSLCLGTDALGNVIESTQPLADAQAGNGWAVLNSVDAGAGTNGAGAVDGISCPTVSLCLAVDRAGNVLYTNQPTATAQAGWVLVPSLNPNGGITGISCPTETECVITDQGGNVQVGVVPFNSRAAYPPPPPPPPLSPPPLPPAKSSISRLSATIHGAQVVIVCSSGTGGCAGSVTLSITEKIIASRVVAFTAKRKKTKVKSKSKIVIIGKASFNIPSGTTKTIAVHYNKVGKALLRRHRMLRGRIDVTQGTVTVSGTASL
jgi:hypothetical protein